MTSPAALATRISALLVAVARGNRNAALALQTELYPLLLRAAKHRARSLSSTSRVGTDGIEVPRVPGADRAAIAHDVTVHALERLIANAGRFDPERGDGFTWAIRQVSFSYIDVVRDSYQSRRLLQAIPTSDEHLVPVVDANRPAVDPAILVELRQQLQNALDSLSPEERRVTMALKQLGLTYAEAAELVYGDARETARVDRVRRTAARKLKDAEHRWQGSLAATETDNAV